MKTTLRVVFPAALSGIVAAIVLGISRAVGETMIVTIAAGSRAQLTFDPREGAQTMTGFIAQVASGDAPQGSPVYYSLFAVGALLFAITFADQPGSASVWCASTGRPTDDHRHP